MKTFTLVCRSRVSTSILVKMLLLGIFIMFFACVSFAQPTSIQLPTAADSNSSFRVLNNAGSTLLRLNADGGFYFGGATMTGMIPVTGNGTRLMWYPGKSAFRVGVGAGTTWDDINIGLFSIAMGHFPVASGESSVAIGENTTASGNYSTAMGYNTKASGNYSTTMGVYAAASGQISTAIGWNTTASGNYSTAMGAFVKASHVGSFIIGDNSITSSYDSSSSDNQMTMRFAGGYRIFSNVGCSAGVYMSGGVSGWNNYCDRNKKANFRQLDGEQILSKIKGIPITEWNYKGTDPNVRYIGPVAQDFYSAFHLGGTDSLGINSICIDGVNMAAIQALEKRTTELQKASEKIAAMEKRIEKLEQMISSPIANKGQ
jgi:hypothetical protein